MEISTLFKAAASVSAFAVMAASGAMLAKSFASTKEIKDYLRDACSSHMTMVISEVQPNNVFEDAGVYLSTRITSTNTNTKAFRIFKRHEEINYTLSLVQDVEFTEGVKLYWTLRCHQIDENTQVRHYDLCFPKKAREMVTGTYLPFVSQVAASNQ